MEDRERTLCGCVRCETVARRPIMPPPPLRLFIRRMCKLIKEEETFQSLVESLTALLTLAVEKIQEQRRGDTEEE